MSIEKFFQKIINDFKSVKISFPENEVREIFEFVLKKDWAFILSHGEKELVKNQELQISNIVKRRLRGEPLAYILGQKNFFGLDFKVNKNTLIPRPETELMIEKALALLYNKKNIVFSSFFRKGRKKEILSNLSCKSSTINYQIIDIGTGSGCIIVSLAKNIKNKNAKFIGLDISRKALNVARKNLIKHGLKNKVTLKKSDLLEILLNKNSKFVRNRKSEIGNSNILILANLPYLSKKNYNSADESIKNYEPKNAFLSGCDGLNHYRKLLDQIKTFQNLFFSKRGVARGGSGNSGNYKSKIINYSTILFFEISPEQKKTIEKEILQRFPTAEINFYKDLAQKWRLVKVVI